MNLKRHPSVQSFSPSIWSKVFNLTEYAALAVSIAGAVTTAATQQAVYAAAPFALSLTLNLANRQRLEHQVHQQITVVIPPLETSLHYLDRRITYSRNHLLVELGQQFVQSRITQVDQATLTAAIAELETSLAQLTCRFNNELQSIALLHSQSAAVSPEAIESIEQSLQRLVERFSVFEAETRKSQFNSSTEEAVIYAAIDQSIQQLFERVTTLEGLLEQYSNPI